jgi:GTP-binding protein Era
MTEPKKCGYIALLGLPNAGKSTFLNRLIGEKVSIVSDKAQTTRTLNLGIYTRDNLQIGFLDLPGVHKPKHEMNRRMMKVVRQGLDDCDLVLHLVDPTRDFLSGNKYIAHMVREKAIPYFLVLNKIDLVNKNKLIAKLEDYQANLEPDEIIPISSMTGENLDNLIEAVKDHLPEGEFLFPEEEYTNQSVRSMVKELIREKVLHYTRDEIPHATTVELDHFEFDEGEGCYLIEAVIFVEKPTQRKILIGKQASMIKKIKNGLPNALSKLLLKPVACDIHVKVSSNWRNQDRFLDKMDI